MSRYRDVTGQQFSCLTAVEPLPKTKGGATTWLCLCSCGKYTNVRVDKLLSSHTKSCGHLAEESLNAGRFRHGMSRTKEYRRIYDRRRRRNGRKRDSWGIKEETTLRKVFQCCVLCENPNDLEVDHLLPSVLGFGLYSDNVVILCRSCNASKGNKYIADISVDLRRKLIEASCEFQDILYDN